MLTANIIIGGVDLTPCEFEIIRQSMMEHTRKELAGLLYKETTTVDSQMRTLYLKLGVRNIIGLVNWGWKHGFDDKGSFTPRDTFTLHALRKVQHAIAARKKEMRSRNKSRHSEGMK